MNQSTYSEFVDRLATNTFHSERVPVATLRSLIVDALEEQKIIDGAKKALFYGKANIYIDSLPRTANEPYPSGSQPYVHAILGIRTEADELLVHLFDLLSGRENVSTDMLTDEIGDVLWYVQLMCNTLGVSMEDAITMNRAKLDKRFPKGFSETRAINPDKDAEAKAQAGIACGSVNMPYIPAASF